LPHTESPASITAGSPAISTSGRSATASTASTAFVNAVGEPFTDRTAIPLSLRSVPTLVRISSRTKMTLSWIAPGVIRSVTAIKIPGS